MSSGLPERAELLGALLRELRNTSTQSVLFSETVAARFGMNPTDLECLGILDETGPITAGRLAELTGLTTGAATRMIDRLERAGYARRERDTDDRRRVIVRVIPEQAREIAEAFRSLDRAMAELCSGYGDEELALILGFASKANSLVHKETVSQRAEGTPRGEAEPAGQAGH